MSTNSEKIKLRNEYENLKKSKFKQQKLPGWRPRPTITTFTVVFISFGVFFLIIGIVMLVLQSKIKEIKYRYDDVCKGNSTCYINFKFEEDIKSKIIIYYQLDNFKQNHRQYINSKNSDQLKGNSVSLQEIINNKDCESAVTNGDIGKGGKIAADGKSILNKDELAIPCGLFAKSYFNDNFTNWTLNGEEIIPNEKDIAYKKDRDSYKNIDLSKQWVDIGNEHFMVWMRPAPFSNFRKLWGRFEDIEIKKGSTISVIIKNNYDVSSFNGKKYLILTTINIFGSKSSFLGISYVVLGSLFIVFALLVLTCFNIFHKKTE